MEILIEREDLISLAISVLCGSIIGFEREYNNKSAGFRTVILICLGSTIFTLVSKHAPGSGDRIAANIITGIGFIGAGVIFKDKLSVLGLTTAAVIWTAAGVGMLTGIGYHMLAICITFFTVISLSLFGNISYILDLLKHSKALTLTFKNTDLNNLARVEEIIKNNKVKSKRSTMNKSNGQIYVTLIIKGNEKQFVKLYEALIREESVTDFY
ncbi:MAG: MgtC/SapB family protein [Ferruginibacter sp.]